MFFLLVLLVFQLCRCRCFVCYKQKRSDVRRRHLFHSRRTKTINELLSLPNRPPHSICVAWLWTHKSNCKIYCWTLSSSSSSTSSSSSLASCGCRDASTASCVLHLFFRFRFISHFFATKYFVGIVSRSRTENNLRFWFLTAVGATPRSRSPSMCMKRVESIHTSCVGIKCAEAGAVYGSEAEMKRNEHANQCIRIHLVFVLSWLLHTIGTNGTAQCRSR